MFAVVSDQQSTMSTGIKIVPPVVFALVLAVGLAIEEFWPIRSFSWSLRIGVALVLLAPALLLIALTLTQFSKSKTPFDVRKTATTLITDGPYRYTRNPGYVALTLLYLSLGSLFGSVWVWLLVAPLLVAVDNLIVQKEEVSLEHVFGEDYRLYRTRVRRWL